MASSDLPAPDADGVALASDGSEDPPLVSVVIPCFNEEEVLEELYRRLSEAAAEWQEALEVILVDDGSTDATWEKMEEIHQQDERWRIVRFSRNFGHQTAVSAGLQYATGDAVIVMDADLQDPPEELHRFIAKWREGYEVAYAIRKERKESVFKRAAYKGFYRLLSSLSRHDIPLDSGDFCLMDRTVVDLINQMPEKNRFVRGLRAWAGFRQTGVEYERHERAQGEPKYTFSKLMKLAIDGIFSFSAAPLRLATFFGLLVSAVAFLGIGFTVAQRLFSDWFAQFGLAPVPGYATMVISVLFIGGVQLVCIGLVGEYVGRIYDETKRRPAWIVQEEKGWEESPVDATPSHRLSGYVPEDKPR
ncbi:dolichol-phosphate mannosyltransferase [Salinibacter ruber]|uniref:Dolichol-phosphate mannosyltransferase n=1 Tax=Salinibacter ruber TaxID=146919 RepID=A0A9X2Q9V4_9BACT|nr:glycosyltransferase family 2 protein [Salinibacter ruber]MCS3679371.1 dolichol-phosphate mannosyltransferase [Salinibacter ruber]MCS3682651.1 dolichol-phosphate mannosyltransferase [Salinibacter ruber]